jgi:hypothetical protein
VKRELYDTLVNIGLDKNEAALNDGWSRHAIWEALFEERRLQI